MTEPDVDAIAELDGAIAAHWLWLRGEGIPTPNHDDDDDGSGTRLRADEPPKEALARLGPIDAMLALERSKAFQKGEQAALMGAVLDSLCRLSRFRQNTVGLERVREDFESRRADSNGLLKKEEALVDLSFDGPHLQVIEKTFAELARKSGLVYGSLRKFRVDLAKRARGYAKGGFHPGLHGAARAMFMSQWIEGRVVDLLLDIERFREEIRGGRASEPLAFSAVPEARALRRVRTECKRLVKHGGADNELISKLFPASEPEKQKARSKDRAQKPMKRRKSA